MKYISRPKYIEQGFAIVEGILIFAIVAIIAGTGYYVLNNNVQSKDQVSNTPKTAVTATKITSFAECKNTSGSKIQETFPEICVTKDGKSFTNTTAQKSQELFISEWGVKVRISGDIEPYYTFTAKGSKDKFSGLTSSQDRADIYSKKFDDTKNADGKQCKDIDDNNDDPSHYSNPPTKRRFLYITKYQSGAVPQDAGQYSAVPPVTIDSNSYVVSLASTFAPGCAVLWRGSVDSSKRDNKIEELEQKIRKDMISDFTLITQ